MRGEFHVTSILFSSATPSWRRRLLLRDLQVAILRGFANLGINLLWFCWRGRRQRSETISDLGVRRVEIGRLGLHFKDARGHRPLDLMPRASTHGYQRVRFRFQTGISLRRSHPDFWTNRESEGGRLLGGVSTSSSVRYSCDLLKESRTGIITGTAAVASVPNCCLLYVFQALPKTLENWFRFGFGLNFLQVKFLQLRST